MITWWILLSALIGYLMGSIPSGYLLAKWARGIDIRQHGSGNIGATNVARVMGLKWFFPVFSLDFLKAFIPISLIRWGLLWPWNGLNDTYLPGLASVAGLAALLGNMFPLFLNFKGGKGAATGLGILVPLTWLPALCAIAAFLLVFAATRYVSLGSILAALTLVASRFIQLQGAAWETKEWPVTVLCLAGASLVIFRHRTNIQRLLAGTETKAGKSKLIKRES